MGFQGNDCKSENENLIKENQKLKKALSKKELNLIKQI